MTLDDLAKRASALKCFLALAPSALAAGIDAGARSPALAPDATLERIALGSSCISRGTSRSSIESQPIDRT